MILRVEIFPLTLCRFKITLKSLPGSSKVITHLLTISKKNLGHPRGVEPSPELVSPRDVLDDAGYNIDGGSKEGHPNLRRFLEKTTKNDR